MAKSSSGWVFTKHHHEFSRESRWSTGSSVHLGHLWSQSGCCICRVHLEVECWVPSSGSFLLLARWNSIFFHIFRVLWDTWVDRLIWSKVCLNVVRIYSENLTLLQENLVERTRRIRLESELWIFQQAIDTKESLDFWRDDSSFCATCVPTMQKPKTLWWGLQKLWNSAKFYRNLANFLHNFPSCSYVSGSSTSQLQFNRRVLDGDPWWVTWHSHHKTLRSKNTKLLHNNVDVICRLTEAEPAMTVNTTKTRINLILRVSIHI